MQRIYHISAMASPKLYISKVEPWEGDSDYLLQFLHVACYLLITHLMVKQVAGKVLSVGCHVDEAVARKVEQDDFLLTSLLAFFCLGNGSSNGVA